ncbi:thioredoxin-disulfide reductase [Suicoccus acidiformans]|uniref:Thioredoxin reductase n=1 Tax=Suicoccus acidiformans TaxID=2036206 RepID=A0A347WNA3_9LACT|nr:thioredoxin-disulfide reductase [Suicoccus acidiformans]AXY26560.1 thioredoxin-disulfide reductase [Suicoccus acidiformans]
MTETTHVADVIVVGAGPAGMTAALYASRANLKVILIEKGAPGGELINTAEVENYPGFPSIPGPDLAQNFYESATAFGAEHVYGDIVRVVPNSNKHEVHAADGTIYEAPVIIIATGSYNRKLQVPGEETLNGRGVSYCAVCDGFFFRDRELAVIGGGDSAVEEGNYLTQFASKVTIIHRRDELRAQKLLQDRVFNNDKVEFLWDSVVDEIDGDESVESLKVRNVKTDEVQDFAVDGVFVYVGNVPNSSLVADLGITDEEGWLITDDEMATSIPGIYAVGDVRQKKLRQVATAVGDGSMAGQQAYEYIESLKD